MQQTRTGRSKKKQKNTPKHEPIAIVGIGCRFPGGANDPKKFWELLISGTDAISEIPADRWNVDKFYDPEPGVPGRTPVRLGGFVDGANYFDPGFFGISPREAVSMDPQQRMLLEAAWEAFEDAGMPLDPNVGGIGGVFVGISTADYGVAQSGLKDGNVIDMYAPTGGTMSIAANRISYCFNLRGPSFIVDTACSSSLVSLHLACRSLWNSECEFALVGGVNYTLNPGTWLGFSRMSMLSADGHCKSFDARADGFVRGEGAGIVLLKPVSAAKKDGDRIYALIRGTAVNQDGSESPAMVMPAQSSQEVVIRNACTVAGIDPREVAFVEAHGTGTPVGDPVEARSLGSVVGKNRPAGFPLLIGSVKSNIGHLESGAGIAGVVKAALSMHYRTVPPSLHFETPNPEIDFEALNLKVPTEPVKLLNGSDAIYAGVNSFGFGGTNAHVILESADCGQPLLEDRIQLTEKSEDTTTEETAEPSEIFLMSARSKNSLKLHAGVLRNTFMNCDSVSSSEWKDICHTLAVRRFHHSDYRGAVVARNPAEVADCIEAVEKGELHSRWCDDENPGSKPDGRVVFVFCGQGTQWFAMGRQLIAEDPVFREKMEECDALIRGLGDWSLIEELCADEENSKMENTAFSQPAIFAVQVALAERWRQWGIEPAAVVGHT
jgi:acyl transferase domain-containing protein